MESIPFIVIRFLGILRKRSTENKIYEHPKWKNYGVKKRGAYFFYKTKKGLWERSRHLYKPGRKYHPFSIWCKIDKKTKGMYLHRFRYESIANRILQKSPQECVDHLCTHSQILKHIPKESHCDWAFIRVETGHKPREGEFDRKRATQSISKSVIEFDNENNFVCEFASVSAAGRAHDVGSAAISYYCEKDKPFPYPSGNGHFFQYTKEQEIDGEEWKELIVHEKKIQVSSHGRVRREKVNARFGSKNYGGYYMIKIMNKNFHVHYLVALTWLNPPPGNIHKEDLVVNHIDEVKTNNHFSNLEWTTRKHNVQYSLASTYILTNRETKEEKRLLGYREVAQFLGCSEWTVRKYYQDEKKWEIKKID